jgi:hypothetical protein
MTQQQKIAAALLKAGVSGDTRRSNPEDSVSDENVSNVQVMTASPKFPINVAAIDRKPVPQETESGSRTLRRLMLWAGPLLALLSLYLLLKSTSLL